MATHTIRKSSQAGIGSSVVELNDVRHVFAAAVPRRGLTLRQQADDALRTIEAVTQEEGTRGSIVHQAVFVPSVNLIDECRQIIRDFYGKEMPATSYIPQPPCEGKLLSIEALGIGRDAQAGTPGEVQIERVSEQLVIARHNHIAWCHCADVVPRNCHDSVYDASLDAFQQIRELLGSVNIPFDEVVRTWLYLGGIVEDEGPTQRYKELNRARTDFYQDIHFLADRLPKPEKGSGTVCRNGPEGAAQTVPGTFSGTSLSGQHGHRYRRPPRDDERDCLGHRSQRHRRRAAGESPADVRVRICRALQPENSEVLPRHGIVLRQLCDDLYLRHGKHHEFRDAARGRRGGPDPRNS